MGAPEGSELLAKIMRAPGSWGPHVVGEAERLRDERLVRRLESFSDLVIGFSLALLSLTLAVPNHVVDLVRNPWWLIAYVWTFTVIASIWYTHQRLFSSYFTVRPFTIFLNFVLLASLGLIVYFVQVFVHVQGEPDKVWAFLAYFFMQSISFIVMGALYAHGVRARWAELDGELRYRGVRQAVRMLTTGGTVLVGVAITAARHPQSIDDAVTVGYISLAGVLGSRVVMRALRSRIANAA